MQVLVNFPKEITNSYGKTFSAKSYFPTVEYLMAKLGQQGSATTKTLTRDDLLKICKATGIDRVIIANPETLGNLVPRPKGGKAPSLTKWRGSRIQLSDTVIAIVIAPIEHIYTVPEAEWLLKGDLRKLYYGHIKPQPFTKELIASPKQMQKWLDWTNDCWLMAVDIETDQHGMKKTEKSSSRVPCFDPQTLDIKGLGETWITTIAFTLVMNDGKYRTCVLPLVNAGGEDFWASDKDYASAIQFMQLMMASSPTKAMHNGLYDCYHLIRYRAWPHNWTIDTMGLSHSWYSELPKDLGFLASWCLYDSYYWKDLADATHKAKDMESYWDYNGKDAWVTARCAVWLLQHGEPHMFSNYKKKFREVYPSLYGAFEGWHVNRSTRDRLAAAAATRLASAKKDLQIIADDPNFNPASAKQKETLLYETIGAVKPTKGKSASKTDKKSRAFVAAQHPILTRVVELLNQYSLDAKAVSTYYRFLIWHDRLLFSLDPFGTETGRDASRGSAAWVGTQIQNQPPYAKEMYCPDARYIGFELDYSKSEAVCSAHLSQCLALIRALCQPELDKEGAPKDFYKHLGTLFFGIEYEKVTKDFRNKVLKKINHGTNYMMGAETFIENLDDINVLYYAAELLGIALVANPSKAKNLDKKEMTMKQFAQTLLDSYHIPFKEVKIWWQAIADEVATTGRLVSPTGHVRIFFGDPRKDQKVQRSAVAHQPQNLSVELLNRGFWKAYKHSQKLGLAKAQDMAEHFNDVVGMPILRIKTQIHDSINGQVLIPYARRIIPELIEMIKARETIHGRDMVIEVDCEVYHTNWKEKESWKDFLETTLPMLESQKLLTSSIAG